MLIQKGIEDSGRQPGSAADAEYLTVSDVARFVLRNLWLVALCTILCAGLALYYARSATEEYTANATILIDRDQTQIAAVSSNTITLANAPVDDDLQIILSDEVLLPVVTRLELMSDPEFEPRQSLTSKVKALFTGTPPRIDLSDEQDRIVTLSILRDKLTVRRVGQSNVLNVFTRSTNPAKAAAITNAIADSFIEQEIEAKATAARRGSAWLANRLEEVREIANSAAINLADFKSENELVDFGDGRFLNEQQLVQINEQLMAARGNLRGLTARLSTLEDALKSDLDPGTLPEIPNNPLILTLRQQIAAQQGILRDMSSRFGAEAVVTQSAQRELDALFMELRGEIERSAQTLRADYEAAKLTEASLVSELEQLIQSQQEKRDARVEFQELESQSRAFRVMYESLLQQYMRSVQLESFPVTDARVVSRASVPLVKSHPKISLILLGGTVFGILLGLGLGLVRLLFKQKVHSSQQVARKTHLPFIGRIPRRRLRELRSRKAIALSDTRNRKYMLALRNLWSSIQVTARRAETATQASKPRPFVIGFTAFDLGDVTNSVTFDLCQIVAARGKRVLYVSSRPLEPMPGLEFDQEYDWADQHNFDAATMYVADGEVVVVAPIQSIAAVPVRGSTSLAAIGALEKLIAAVKRQFSVIVVDLPLVGTAPEIRELQQHFDALFINVREGKTYIDDLVEAADARWPGAPILTGYAIIETGWGVAR